MPLPSDPTYYEDCYDLFQRAISSPHGVQITCADNGAAQQFRQRMHKARSLSRELSKKVWPEQHPLHNTSEFYKVVIKIVFDGKRWLLRLEKRDATNLEIEDIIPAEISEAQALPEVVFEETGKLPMIATEIMHRQEEEQRDLRDILAQQVTNDEFDLEPTRDLEPSPPVPPRVRRL